MEAGVPPGLLVLIGAGPVGVAAARAALDHGAVDGVSLIVDPDEAARTAAVEALGGTAASALEDAPPAGSHSAIVAFSSAPEPSAGTMLALLEAGLHTVTTCEELSDPPAALAAQLDEAARRAGRVAVATGANPGFAMDRFPLMVAAGSSQVRRVVVERRLDTSTRRGPLVAKTGRGLTPEQFREGAADGTIGHVGLDVSARLIAAGLGWDVGGVESTLEPLLDEAGVVLGLHQTARVADGRGREVLADLVMAWDAPDPVDRVRVEGAPPLVAEIRGGYHGDLGTSARVAVALAATGRLAPGFYRPADLPVWA